MLQLLTKPAMFNPHAGRRAASGPISTDPAHMETAQLSVLGATAQDRAAAARLHSSVGNQAVLRMLAGEPHARDVAQSGALTAGPLAGNGAISGAGGGPIVQRQDAGGADTTMTNAPPAGGAGATQAANVPWSTNLLDASIENAEQTAMPGHDNIGWRSALQHQLRYDNRAVLSAGGGRF